VKENRGFFSKLKSMFFGANQQSKEDLSKEADLNSTYIDTRNPDSKSNLNTFVRVTFAGIAVRINKIEIFIYKIKHILVDLLM
jgi:hypothetical protein